MMKHFFSILFLVFFVNVKAFSQCTADAGPFSANMCASTGSFTLSGSVTGGTAMWTSSGSGSFNDNTLANATYMPSAAEISAGYAFLTLTTVGCGPVNDTISIIITAAPTVNAGTDQVICGSPTLNGMVTGATGGVWTSSGSGTFSPNNNTLTANYNPSAADITSGSVTLTLTSTGNGACSAVTDNMVVTLSPGPVVDAGLNQTVCGTSPVVLNGSVTNATGGLWTTTGNGTFSPSNTTLTANYIPALSDSVVMITLTSTGNGPCTAVSDNLVLTINPGPTVNAGTDQVVCGSPSLNGIVTGATGGVWTSSGTGAFSPSNTMLTANYIPSGADMTAGTVTLTLTSTGNGACSAVTDNVVLTLSPGPVVNAGTNQTQCRNQSAVLSGSVTVATGGIWSTNGSGVFSPNNSTLNASYIPSVSDSMVILTLTSTGNGACAAVSDNMVITYTPDPVVSSGIDQTVCDLASSITLNGSVVVATGGIWTSSGTGSFSPNNSTLTGNYIPSAADKTAGTVTLTLTSTGNGSCNAVTDAMVVTFTSNSPSVNAGTDQTICGNQAVTLNGTVLNATGGSWVTSGTGTFNNSNSLTASYTPSTTDVVSGSVSLTLTSTGNGGCVSASDVMTLSIVPSPVVNAGPNQILSSGAKTLSGTVSNASGGVWTTSGTGSFSNPSLLTATYTPSGADTASGSVVLTLTSTGNGLCNAVSDNMVLTGNPVVCNVAVSTTATNNSVEFSATNSDGTSIGSYFWNFGDGTYASGKVQNHIYASAGSYSASVFYTTPDSACYATEYKTITIASAPISTYLLSGTVLAGSNSLDLGVVSLFKLSGSNYDLLLTKTISPSDNGLFSFSNLDNGYYLLHSYINPSSAYFSNYLASYFGGVTAWGGAVAIQVNNGNVSSKNINLFAYTCPDVTWNTGADTIKGVITFDQTVVLRTTGATENPVENALVTLYNSNGDKLISVYTDAFGNYEFSKLITGNYTVKVEYAGGSTPSASLAVAVDGNPTTVNSVNTEVLKQAVALGVITSGKVMDITMYPNPVASEVNIELPSDVNGLSTLYIYDALGQLKYKADYNVNSGDKLTVETNSLATGFYIVELVIGEKLYKGKITKK